MFPTLVWKFQLKPQVRRTMDEAMLRALGELRRERAVLAPHEGWQSERALHEREAFVELATCVHEAALSVLRFLRSGHDTILVTGCWASVLAPGAAHRSHAHPNNYLSGVYYLSTPPGADTINFHDPRVQTAVIRPPVTALSAENTDQVVLRVERGTLLLFPAWLQHSVDANASGEERVSISFNLMFPDFATALSKPLW